MNERQKILCLLTGVLTCSHCFLLEESLSSHPLLRKPRKIYWKALLPALGMVKFAFPTVGKLWETMPKPCYRLFSLWMLMQESPPSPSRTCFRHPTPSQGDFIRIPIKNLWRNISVALFPVNTVILVCYWNFKAYICAIKVPINCFSVSFSHSLLGKLPYYS